MKYSIGCYLHDEHFALFDLYCFGVSGVVGCVADVHDERTARQYIKQLSMREDQPIVQFAQFSVPSAEHSIGIKEKDWGDGKTVWGWGRAELDIPHRYPNAYAIQTCP